MDADRRAAPARLLGLRVQGFKSFADRTIVEFGAGISAVVGPNGSGKSNLADALRWALGEQGRSLRTRKSEDVIFAGSERRAALGMADVTLVLDNADGLLPVEYQVVELGRRLYRSGENDYLLNKQRVRLRDLVDLLDAAHLADNAFLFIGQGMVDQALALRPEERRPLFEEVAGVRRHERRRRRAEEQLVEAEANLARVEDIVGELRPQARRLAAQAEQQTTRTTAGEELAAALVLAAHARWHEGATRARQAAARFSGARREVDAALAGLQAAERDSVAIAGALAGRAEVEREARAAHDEARSTLTALRLRAERLASELEAVARDRRRVDEERRAAEAAIDAGRRELSQPAVAHDMELEAALDAAERALADALVELATARSARAARGEALAAARRAEAARQAELDAARRRLAEAERRVEEARAEAAAAAGTRDATTAGLVAADGRLAAAVEAGALATRRLETARTRVESLEGVRRAADERASALSSRVAAMTGQLQAHRARLAEEESRGIARGARRHGGRRLDEDLDVEPGFRAAVEAALGDALRAYVVDAAAVMALGEERGTLALGGHGAESGPPSARERGAGGDAAVRRLVERVEERGGGLLGPAIRRDGTGIARRLLATSVWLPDLAAAMAVQDLLPAGWVAVTRNGSAIVRPITVSLGGGESVLDRRAEVAALQGEVDRARTELAAADAERTAAGEALRATRDEFEAARNADSAAGAARRRAEDEQRAAARDAERAAREAAWHAAQLERLVAERDRGRAGAPASTGNAPVRDLGPVDASGEDATADDAGALALLDARVAELRGRRDRLAAEHAAHEARRQDAERRRSRAEAAVALDEQRLVRADRDAAALADRELALETERSGLGEETALARARDEQTRRAVDELQAADAADRGRMAEADATATRARERLRTAEDRLRSAEVGDLEARLALEAVREQVLVELAGLGEPGINAMRDAAGPSASAIDAAVAPAAPARSPSVTHAASSSTSVVATPEPAATIEGEGPEEGSAALEGLLDVVAVAWEDAPPRTDTPSAGRLGALRRRYHELGAPNPFAVEEYAVVRARLESLEGQRDDLRSAINRTRTLIEDLDRMIAEQFRMTFQALEVAFDARFRQLFGGGFARLTLTEPADLAATGVEIVARPPGKKAQALAMLSGGERALTAVALLFAMLEVRPVPFCVLDEVDAALDEANVDRFAETLRGLATHTQFVVITHNRGTIEAADALYGVTVGDDSVSRVISLRLEEATAIAEAVAPVESIAG